MATGASSWADASVTKGSSRETCVILVAGIARRRCCHVIRSFAQCIPLRIGTVVAGGALTDNYSLGAGMRESRGREAAAC